MLRSTSAGRASRPTERVAALTLLAVLAAGCGGGGDRIAGGDLPKAPAALHLSSPAFTEGSRLPKRYTCDGAGDEPKVQAGTTPPSTQEMVTVVTDPDAPGGTFVHLTRYGDREGENSAGKTGWTPPCPPEGDAAHRYVWSVYALRHPLSLDAGAAPAEVTKALRDDGILAAGTITARYGR